MDTKISIRIKQAKYCLINFIPILLLALASIELPYMIEHPLLLIIFIVMAYIVLRTSVGLVKISHYPIWANIASGEELNYIKITLANNPKIANALRIKESKVYYLYHYFLLKKNIENLKTNIQKENS